MPTRLWTELIVLRLHWRIWRGTTLVRFHLMKMTTNEASTDFEDESLDFVYLDAGHMSTDVKMYLEHWWGKVKKEGILAGDDYFNGSVNVRVVCIVAKIRPVVVTSVPSFPAIIVKPSQLYATPSRRGTRGEQKTSCVNNVGPNG